MRDVAVALPPSVLARSLALAGEEDDAVGELMIATTLTLGGLYDRLEHGHHDGRAGFVDDWQAIEALAADVPELREPAGWLMDQIARRDAPAQQLRAVLEPDITDYLHDREISDQQPDAAPPRLDGPRTAHLAQAREAVRAYTAAAYSGRETEAQQLLDAFPVPARALHVSGPARTWREQSATARQAVHTVTALRATATATAAAGAESGADPLLDPERLHAKSAYLAARDAQLRLQHDVLGRLAAPTPLPYGLPEELHEVAAHGMQRRLAEAFGSPERARQVIEGRITYHHQQSVAGAQRESAAEAALLTAARATLDAQPVQPAYALLDEQLIARRVDRIMSAPVPLPAYEPPSPGERQRSNQAQPSASSPDPGTGGLRP